MSIAKNRDAHSEYFSETIYKNCKLYKNTKINTRYIL